MFLSCPRAGTRPFPLLSLSFLPVCLLDMSRCARTLHGWPFRRLLLPGLAFTITPSHTCSRSPHHPGPSYDPVQQSHTYASDSAKIGFMVTLFRDGALDWGQAVLQGNPNVSFQDFLDRFQTVFNKGTDVEVSSQRLLSA